MVPLEVFNNNNHFVKILSFPKVESRFCITFGTEMDSAINIYLDYGTIIKLNQCSKGIYYYDTTNMENNNINNQGIDYSLFV